MKKILILVAVAFVWGGALADGLKKDQQTQGARREPTITITVHNKCRTGLEFIISGDSSPNHCGYLVVKKHVSKGSSHGFVVPSNCRGAKKYRVESSDNGFLIQNYKYVDWNSGNKSVVFVQKKSATGTSFCGPQ